MKASTWLPVLRVLASGEQTSGALIGETLGLTRAAIWQRVSYLRSLGLPIHASETGYRLDRGAYWPSAQAIDPLVSLPVQVVAETLSTNQDVLQQAPDACCVIAGYQSAGRGRRGRTWNGVPGRTLMLSVGLSLSIPVTQLSGLSIAVGVALCELLNAWRVPARLKWPNDLWIGDRKLGGFLMELQGDVHDAVYVVVGLGLNVKSITLDGINPASIDETPKASWTDTDTALVIECIERVTHEFPAQDPASLVERFHRVSALTGRQLTVSDGRHERSGVMAGINAEGAMLLMTDDGIITISAGDVSVRPLA